MFGFGMDTSSATSQSAPFFNNAGINFGGDQGGIEASGDFSADAQATANKPTAARQTLGGVSPVSSASDPVGFFGGGGGSLLPYIIAAALVSIGAIWYVLKK
jgi:hypothetical protein